jgi:hypothetical protein
MSNFLGDGSIFGHSCIGGEKGEREVRPYRSVSSWAPRAVFFPPHCNPADDGTKAEICFFPVSQKLTFTKHFKGVFWIDAEGLVPTSTTLKSNK